MAKIYLQNKICYNVIYKTMNKLIISAIASIVLFIFLPHVTLALESEDIDNDGITDTDELTIYHTDPLVSDTDGDGYTDGLETTSGYSPLVTKKKLRQIDTDRDGLWDDWELALGTDITKTDTDGDGYSDGKEMANGYDPRSTAKQKLSYRIEVSLHDQQLRYYFGKTKLDGFAISSGLRDTPTPIGKFSVVKKRPIVHYAGVGFNYPNTKWNLMFKQQKNEFNYYIHGAYWHNSFGKPKSHGCVNVPHVPEYMGRLYDWAKVGTLVTIIK